MNSKLVHLFNDMVLFVSSFAILLAVLFANNTQVENNYIINRLNNSWNKYPITIVQAISDKICEVTRTNKFTISNYHWPGNSPGCDCSNITQNDTNPTKYRGNFYKGNCDGNQTIAGCDQIIESETLPLFKWKNNYFCHRALNERYFELIKVKRGEECPNYYRNCGKIDTLDNQLCILSAELCPINYFRIMADHDALRFDISTHNPDGFILTEFHATDGDNVCFNNEENLFTENEYILISEHAKIMRNGCTSFVLNPHNNIKLQFDSRFKIVDSYSKKLFYEHNSLNFVNKLPHFLNITSNKTINLFAAPYIGWDKNCTFIGKKNILEEFEKISKQNDNLEKNNMIIIYLAILILPYIGINIFYLKYKYSEVIDNNLTVPMRFFNKFMVIYLFFSGINFCIYYLTAENQKSIYLNQIDSSYLYSLFNQNCSDHETNISLIYFGNDFFSRNKSYNYIIFCVFLNIIASVFICIFGFYSKRKSDYIFEFINEDKKLI